MLQKLLSLIIIILLIISNEYFLQKPPIFHIFGFVFVGFVYYWYQKLISFCQIKIKKIEETNMMSSEFGMNQICDLPVIWSERLNYRHSPFLEACKNGNTDLVKSMIKAGVNVHETNIFGEGAIFLATTDLLQNLDKKDATCIWTLHKAGCSLDIPNKDGFTPLHLAAFKGHCSLISWLIKKGANYDIKPSPAGLALIKGHNKAAALLLAYEYKIPLPNRNAN